MTLGWEIANLIAFVPMIISNAIFTRGWFGMKTPKEVADDRKSHFTPSDLTFSIWGLVFAYQLVFIILTMVFPDTIVGGMGPWLICVYILVGVWPITAGYELRKLSTSIIYSTVSFLGWIYFVHLDVNYFQGNPYAGVNWWIMFVYNAPFSIFFSWIVVAAFASTAVTTNYADELNESIATELHIYALAIPTVLLLHLKNDFFFAITTMWALIGIQFKNCTSDNRVLLACSIEFILVSLTIGWRVVEVFFIKNHP